jgi:hypothetical protein
MDPAKIKNLIIKIPKFSGQNKEIQLEEFVQQIEDFAELVQWWTRHKDGENEEICLLFRRKLEGQADQIWRFLEEEEINLNIWENLKSQFQEYYPMKIKTPIAKKIQKVHPKRKASQIPRVMQGPTEGINSFADRCREEVGKQMKKVPSPEESQMRVAHSELLDQDKEQIKGAHLGEASETLAKTMFYLEELSKVY